MLLNEKQLSNFRHCLVLLCRVVKSPVNMEEDNRLQPSMLWRSAVSWKEFTSGQTAPLWLLNFCPTALICSPKISCQILHSNWQWFIVLAYCISLKWPLMLNIIGTMAISQLVRRYDICTEHINLGKNLNAIWWTKREFDTQQRHISN